VVEELAYTSRLNYVMWGFDTVHGGYVITDHDIGGGEILCSSVK
jgi:hypothetical protein